jgi:hypothetical protein
MNGILKSLIGRKVTVYSTLSSSSARDDGILQSADEQCIVLEKGEERLVFILANVRLIKVLE